MKVIDALKPTGKAYREDNFADYVMLVNNTEGSGSLLHWFNAGEDIGEVVFEDQGDDKWQPYPEVKEIRPEKAGELWYRSTDKKYYHTEEFENIGLRMVSHLCAPNVRDFVYDDTWTRIFPEPEDDRVVFIDAPGGPIFPTSRGNDFSNGSFLKFKNKPPMKMILEIPKED